jgi:NAD(P)-dependent dehydrogenase (short-subunit alcohol dehydrogenase family)
VSLDQFSLDGRVAIVTGGGGGLGVGICRTLAAAGAAVVVAGRTPATLEPVVAAINEEGGKAVTVEVDIANKASVEAMVAKTVQAFGGVDVLVNNAAVYHLRPWTEITEEEWDEVHGTNLKGYFLCARAAYPSMKSGATAGSSTWRRSPFSAVSPTCSTTSPPRPASSA